MELCKTPAEQVLDGFKLLLVLPLIILLLLLSLLFLALGSGRNDLQGWKYLMYSSALLTGIQRITMRVLK